MMRRGTCSTQGKYEKLLQFLEVSLNRRYHMWDPSAEKVKVRSAISWIRTGSKSRLLCSEQGNFGFHTSNEFVLSA